MNIIRGVIVKSGHIYGLRAYPLTVTVKFDEVSSPGFTIVGLPDAAVQESRERVRSAIRNCRLEFPTKR